MGSGETADDNIHVFGEAILCSFRDFGRLEDGEGVALK